MYSGTNSSVLQPVWDKMLGVFGKELFEFPIHYFPAIFFVIVVMGTFFTILDCFIYKKFSLKEALLDGAWVLSKYFISAALLFGLHWYFKPFVMDVPQEAPTLFSFITQILVFMILGEFFTYWWHRVEHGSTFVFKKSHHVHHECKVPISVWTNFYLHPTEGLMVMTGLYLSPHIFGAHPLVFWGYAMLNTFAMVMTHVGYSPKFYPTWFFPSPTGHDLHHEERVPVNFSVVMAYGDKLFGTYKNPDVEEKNTSSISTMDVEHQITA